MASRIRRILPADHLAQRLVRLYAGLAGFGISLALMVRARLGVGPWDVLHQGIARQLGVQIGWVVIAMSAVVLLAWIPLRQRPGLGTISNLVLVGLDRLSGGRLLLGLGAGSDDSEFRGLGLPARTPADKVRGLDDAVRIVRGMWSEPSFTHHGMIYHTEQARLEPKPGHRIPIWLGTFGTRALEVTGRLADGWIPSRGYVPDEALAAMRDRVLAAAEQAGRDPASITCALNTQVIVDDRGRHRDADLFTGPPAKIADGVRHFAELGFTAFNFIPAGENRAAQVRRLAEEVLCLADRP